MAFPQVVATNGGEQGSLSQSHTINLPANIASGNLLIILFKCRASTTISWPAGWTEIFQDDGGRTQKLGACYKVAEGNEGATALITTSGNVRSAHISYRITNYSGAPEAGTVSDATGSTPNPPSLSPSWGQADSLWLAICGWSRATSATLSSYPSNYTDGHNYYNSSTSGCGIASAQRELNASSEDPGTFGLSASAIWLANTIAIKPEVVTEKSDSDAIGVVEGTPTLQATLSESDSITAAETTLPLTAQLASEEQVSLVELTPSIEAALMSGDSAYIEELVIELSTGVAPQKRLLIIRHPALLKVAIVRYGNIVASWDALSNLDEERITKELMVDALIGDEIEVTTLPGLLFKRLVG